MKPHDPTLLTAYLDDELTEPDRLAVEATLRSDPGLADDLGRLRAVSELLVGMDRPSLDRDLSASIVCRLATPRRTASRSRILTVGATLSTAACLVVALTAFLHSPTAVPPRINRPFLPNVPNVPAQIPSVVSTPPNPEPPPDRPALTDARGPDEDERLAEAERQRVLGLLDRPGVRRMIVTADVLEPAASDVDDLLRNTPRRKPRYGRIAINEGVIVDPDEPSRAVVFVVLLDATELDYFRDRLGRDPRLEVGRAEPAPPAVVTLLSDPGRVDDLPGTLAAIFSTPPPGVPPIVAQRKAPEQNPLASPVTTPKSEPSGDGEPAVPESDPDAETGTAPPAGGPEEPATVLIWVTAPETEGHDAADRNLDAH